MTEPPFLLANDPAGSYWDDLLDDAHLVARAYRDRGWEVLVLEPEDVSPTMGDRPGLTALLSDTAYDTVETLLSRESTSTTFTDLEHSRRSVRDAVFLLLVERDLSSQQAIVLPLYYFIRAAEPVLERVATAGEMPVHLRPRSATDSVSFVHTDPSLFQPGPDRHRRLLTDGVTVEDECN